MSSPPWRWAGVTNLIAEWRCSKLLPAHESAHPLARLLQRLKALGRIARTVLQGAEEGLGLGVVVAHAGTAERRGNAQLLERRQHRGARASAATHMSLT